MRSSKARVNGKNSPAIRPKSKGLSEQSWLENNSSQLSREKAIAIIVSLTTKRPDDSFDSKILSLIELFNLTPEELTEAGLRYETIKTIEQNCLAWRLH